LNKADEFLIEERTNEGEAQTGCFSFADAADSLGSAVQVTKNGPRIFQEKYPRFGQRNRVGIAGEDFGSELFLQRLNVAGERRLGEMNLPCRFGKVEVIRNGNKAFEFANIDPVHAETVIPSCCHSNSVKLGVWNILGRTRKESPMIHLIVSVPQWETRAIPDINRGLIKARQIQAKVKNRGRLADPKDDGLSEQSLLSARSHSGNNMLERH